MSNLNETETKSARSPWAAMNVHGAQTLDELRQSLVTFDSGDKSEAIADCERWNECFCDATGNHQLDLDDWYGGIEDAIKKRAKYE